MRRPVARGALLLALLASTLGLGSRAAARADPPAPPSVEAAADAARAAAAAQDQAALEALARSEDPDPWLVSEELEARGDVATARALATAGGATLAPLVVRLAGAPRAAADPELRRAVLEVRDLLALPGTDVAARALALLDGVRPDADALLGSRWWFGRAHALRALGRGPESAAAFLESASLAESLGWWLRARQALTQALLTARDVGELGAARDAGARWLALETAHGGSLGQAAAHLHLASVALRAKDWEAYAGHEQRGLELLAASASPQVVAGILAELGDQLAAVQEPQRAGDLYARAAVAWGAVPDRLRAAGALHDLSLALGRVGRDRESVDAARRAVALLEEAGDAAGALRAKVHVSEVLFAVGQPTDARSLAEGVLPPLEAAGDVDGQARAWVIVGLAASARIDGARAWAAGERARELAARAGAARSAAMAELVLGSAGYALGKTAETIEHLERALPALEAVGLGEAGASAAQLLGLAYLRVGDPERATLWLDRAAARVPAGSLLASMGLALRAMARAAAGDTAGARELVEPALARDPYFRGGPTRVALLGLLATIHGLEGDWVGGLAPLKEAQVAIAGKDPVLEAGLRVTEVSLRLRAGDTAAAAALAEPALAAARDLAVPLFEAGALGNLAEVRLLVDRRPEEALTLSREALEKIRLAPDATSDEHLAAARAADTGYSSLAVRAAIELDRPAVVLEFLEHDRALTLLAALGSRAAVRAWVLPAELLAAEKEARAEESRATASYRKARTGGDAAGLASARQRLEGARQGVEDVLERIAREAPRAAALADPRPATLEQAQASLGADEALVLYGLLYDRYVALRVERTATRVVALGPSADVEAKVTDALEALGAGSGGAAALETLRSALVEPLGLPAGLRRLRLVPDAVLAFVPFPALLPGVDVAVLPSASVGLALVPEGSLRGEGVLAVGDPDLGAGPAAALASATRGAGLPRLGRLPAAAEEARAVGDVVLLGAEATEDALTAALATRPRWRALHLACHGLLDPQRGTRSALLLAPSVQHDGLWRAADVLRSRVPADLVVLSACETGKGRVVKGEGVLGLTRAFLYAGAPRVLCSLWKVDDQATRALMTRFYELFHPPGGAPGLPPARALRLAQEHVRAQARWAHPRYWAAWVLWGLGD